MSRTRYPWWGYAKKIIRLQPEREAMLRARQQSSVIAGYSAQPRSGNAEPRPVEALATASLGESVDAEMEAVRRAVMQTRGMACGEERLRLVDMVFWKRTHTLEGACDALHISYRTGRRWHWDFIHLVGEQRGLC